MTPNLVAFQGEPGAFSHQACSEALPAHDPLPCPTFEDAIEAVRSGKADRAVLPIENSIYGRVADLHHLLPESGLFIIAEHFLPIRLNLLGCTGATLDGVRWAHSHTVALGQCRDFLRKYEISAVAGADTAGSAAVIADKDDPSHAAIASSLAGQLHGLDVLAENIEDAAHNTTRFLVLARNRVEVDPSAPHPLTTIVFEVGNMPAALYKAMGGFATNGVNMVKLESYMLNGSFKATQFYADIEGHREAPAVKHAFRELEFFTGGNWKVLGTYGQHPYRREGNGTSWDGIS